jgi:nucleoside-diphosphate-sugar epimerase
MFLGRRGTKATGQTPPDPKAQLRADYARAKALTDVLLLELHQEHGVPLSILRPAIVVGEGGTPFHSGVGLFVNEQHCLGWSRGNIPLPFVLARDVAAAAAALERDEHFCGQFYNLAGDVRLTAAEYIAELASVLGRPITFHPQTTEFIYLLESGKGLIKRLAGKSGTPTTLRDLRSRAFLSEVDCAETKRDLAWRPESDRRNFIREAIEVHDGAL